ncbi:AMP phosphorylase [Candidatus Woesearchaeota archaeon]|nr:AMP phosphorylase [Candidatus Woesearchaeota archaeon]
MKLIVKDVDIFSGGPPIVVLNEEDARKLDLHTGDRVKLHYEKKVETGIVDMATAASRILPPGSIALFDELIIALGVRTGDVVEVRMAQKPDSLGFIKKKLEGKKLLYKEINSIIEDIVNNNLSEIELTYFVAACYIHELDLQETIDLTKAIYENGEQINFKGKTVVDKHCVGGVAGNRTTPIVVSIVAAAGLIIPKTSSRSITSPAGTADTIEVLANVTFSADAMKEIVRKTGACMIWGGGVNIAPADDKIIKVEYPMSLDPIGQLLASVLAKKKAVGVQKLLIDIPYGLGSKIPTRKKALDLERKFKKVCKALKMTVDVVLTPGFQPIGNGIGPNLEARDSLYVLENDDRQPMDLRRKAITLAGRILELGGVSIKSHGKKLARRILDSGAAYQKFREIIAAQGGVANIRPEHIRVGAYRAHIRAPKNGVVSMIPNKVITAVARVAGAPQDAAAGVYLYKHVSDFVKKDEILFTVFSDSKEKLKYAVNLYKKLVEVQIH